MDNISETNSFASFANESQTSSKKKKDKPKEQLSMQELIQQAANDKKKMKVLKDALKDSKTR